MKLGFEIEAFVSLLLMMSILSLTMYLMFTNPPICKCKDINNTKIIKG